MTAPIVIGLALRGDDDAPLALGRALAVLAGAPIALVHAVHLDPLAADSLPLVEPSLRRGAIETLEHHAASLRDVAEVTVAASPGSPAAVLRAEVRKRDAGLLVVGSSPRGRFHAGHTAARAIHGASCAVAVAPRGHIAGPVRRIAVAWDGSPESEDALSTGVGIALLAGAALTTFTVVAPGQGRDAALVQRATALVPEDLLEGADVLTGDPAAALSAVSIGFDLMTCGSRSYGPLRSVLLGSCSRELLHRSACPLLILPRGPRSRLHLLDRRDAAGASA